MEYSGRLIFDSAVPRGGGGQMLLFDGGGIFQGATTPAVAVEAARRKRPFLATHEELMLEEEVYYDEQAPEPEKKRRLTPEQVRMLEQSFEEEKRKLEPERKSELAQRLGMAPRQVAVWFQNRRARWKAKQLEQDFDRLKAAHDALLADRDTLKADNHRLRFEVISLTEKLQAKEQSTSEITRPEAAVFQLKEDHLSSVLEVAEGTHHGGDSNVTGEEGNNGGTRSSSLTSDDGATAIGNEGGSFFPDAMFVAYTNPLWC